MTAPTGVGRGGPRPGSGRPHGSTNHRTRKLIVEAERTGQLMPLDLLLAVVRDPEAPRRERLQAAAIAAPFCHPRLVAQYVVQGFVDPNQLSDDELLASIAHLEQLAAATSEGERTETVTQVEPQSGAVIRRPIQRPSDWHQPPPEPPQAVPEPPPEPPDGRRLSYHGESLEPARPTAGNGFSDNRFPHLHRPR